MKSSDYVELALTCPSWQEAQRIADKLLEKQLVAWVEMMEVKSKYLWHDMVDETKEIKLVMETIAENFEKIERQVTKLHSYDTFVLQQIPLTKLSTKTQTWLSAALK